PLLLAGAGGTAIGVGYGRLAVHGTRGWPVPYAALLVPVGVYAACLLAAAASLPFLRRSVRPGELRYA
ncbi:ABC transporter permease, partial [Streptomyces sp. SID10815]|nr:ABC transporter permease [Streptomyces sp. SID10815]